MFQPIGSTVTVILWSTEDSSTFFLTMFSFFQSQYGSLTRNRDDEDETGSVASVGSSFSMSSEMSTFSPHTKYSNPVQVSHFVYLHTV